MARPISWFAGHMVAALKDAATRLKAVDVVVEVRDARVSAWPAAGRLRMPHACMSAQQHAWPTRACVQAPCRPAACSINLHL